METIQETPQVVYVEKKKRRIWPWVLLGVFVFLVGGCGVTVAAVGGAAHQVVQDQKNDPKHATLNEYNMIQPGMTMQQVEKIVGGHGTPTTTTEIIPGHQIQSYDWEGNTIISNMTLLFENGKVYSKSQYGLEQ